MKTETVRGLKRLMDGRWTEREPLARHTTWRTGGPAALMVFPENEDMMSGLLAFCTEHRVPWFVLGNGSNILADDRGFAGCVINLCRAAADGLKMEDEAVRAPAGMPLRRVIREQIRCGRGGLHCLAGIPGTVGGAVATNAGVPGCETGDYVRTLVVFEGDGSRRELQRREISTGYRYSSAQNGNVIWSAVFGQRDMDPERIRQEVRRRMAGRIASQPVREATAGSVFRNPAGDRAGRLIEAAGCKGIREGRAAVSRIHANFIVNEGGATARDIRRLMERIRERVLRQTGTELEPEVRIIG